MASVKQRKNSNNMPFQAPGSFEYQVPFIFKVKDRVTGGKTNSHGNRVGKPAPKPPKSNRKPQPNKLSEAPKVALERLKANRDKVGKHLGRAAIGQAVAGVPGIIKPVWNEGKTLIKDYKNSTAGIFVGQALNKGKEMWAKRPADLRKRLGGLALVGIVSAGVADISSSSRANRPPTVAAAEATTTTTTIPSPTTTERRVAPTTTTTTTTTTMPRRPDPRLLWGEQADQRSQEAARAREARAAAEAAATAAEAQRQADIENYMITNRPMQIANLANLPDRRIATVQLVQTAEDTNDPTAPQGAFTVNHAVRVGALTGPGREAWEFDTGIEASLDQGAFMHVYGASVPDIDYEKNPASPPIVLGFHHLSEVQDPAFPDQQYGWRWPGKTRIADPAAGIAGDTLTLTLLSGEVRTYQAVDEAIISTDVPNPEEEAKIVFGSKYPLVIYNCKQSPEELAAAAPGVAPEADDRYAVFFDLVSSTNPDSNAGS